MQEVGDRWRHVCPSHGGRAPQVIQAAQRRLMAYGVAGLDVLGDLMGPENPPQVRLAACLQVLDRVGLPERPIDPTAFNGEIDPEVARIVQQIKDGMAAAERSRPRRDPSAPPIPDLEEPVTREAYWKWRETHGAATSMGSDFDGSTIDDPTEETDERSG